jgi:RNA polymerase sigma-70 factor (ECF subfamily)
MSAEVRDETFLLARARQGDLPAFEEIVRRYGVALRIVRSHAVADDVVQEAFLKAWQSLDRFELGRPFGPWVCRIAANQAVNHVRSPRSREDPLPEGHGETPAAADSPLDAVLDREAREVLEDALGTLPAEQRATFVLRAVEEMSYAEIAETLGVSPGTVMSRLFRARQKLAKAVGPYLGPAARSRAGEGT